MPGLIDLLQSNYSFNNPNGVARNRMGGVVDDSDIISGAMQGLANILGGAARGSITSGLGIPGDINQAIVNNLGSLLPNAPALPTTNQWQQLLPGEPTSHEGQIYQKLGEMTPAPIPIGEFAKVAGNAINDAMVYGAGPLAKITPQPMRLTAWHGSPHTFNKFDMSKIGTGEGGQAYGHGLYLAENPEVAKSYSNKLTKVDGQSISDQLDSRTKYLKILKEEAANGNTNSAKNIPIIEKSISDLVNKGNVYKIDLPDKHIEKMLDWDKPLSEQHEAVKKAFNSIKEDPSLLDKDTLKWMKENPDPTGRAFYNQLSMSDNIAHPSEASNILNKMDIPGIKYLDEQSRGAGDGTRNFVIFDPNIAKIEERNSVPIPQDPHQPNYLEDVHKALGSKFEYPREEALKTAQKNAALPVSEGGLGLPKDNTPEMRAKAMGFDTNVYHGSKTPELINETGHFIPGGREGSVRSGDAYGVGAYSTSMPSEASAPVYTGESGAVYPLLINRENHLIMDNPSSQDLAKLTKYANENLLPSDKSRFKIGIKEKTFLPENLQDAKDFFENQRKNYDQFGDNMVRNKPIVDKNKEGHYVVKYTDFDFPIEIKTSEDIQSLLKSVGYDEVKNMGYSGLTMNRPSGKQWDVTNDMSSLRSPNAAFDPMKRYSPDLLAGVVPLGLGGAALSNQPSDQQPDVHSPTYLEDLHTMLGLKSKDFNISDVYSPTYLGDLHSFLSTQNQP